MIENIIIGLIICLALVCPFLIIYYIKAAPSAKDDTMILKNIKEYTKERKDHLEELISVYMTKEQCLPPQLAIIQIGNNEASNRYIRNKIKDCEEVSICAHNYVFDENISQDDLIWEIQHLQEHYDGLIVQLPLPDHIRAEKVAAAIDPVKDVDGFHPMSLYKPATPLGIMMYLKDCGFEFDGANVVIIGRSEIVGKPLAQMMTDANATVTLCHSRTKNLWDHIQEADLVVSAVGKPKFLNCYAIHVPVIDVGINFDEDGRLCGDCYNTENRDVTPVPGGVGLLTRWALLENAFSAKLTNDIRKHAGL